MSKERQEMPDRKNFTTDSEYFAAMTIYLALNAKKNKEQEEPKSRRWISVKTSLPPLGKYVLCRHTRGTWYDNDDQANVNCIVLKRIGAKIESNNKVPYEWSRFGPDKFFGQDISHWMPIIPLI